MEWISVQEDLPKDREQVLVLAYGNFPNATDPLYQKISRRIFQGTFSRSRGWFVPYMPECAINYWMPIPKFPEET